MNKPCPFCGPNENVHLFFDSGSNRYYVGCLSCFVRGPEVSTYHSDHASELAVEKWNTRPLEKEVDDEVREDKECTE